MIHLTETYNIDSKFVLTVIDRVNKLNQRANRFGSDDLIICEVGTEFTRKVGEFKVEAFTPITLSYRQPLFAGWSFVGQIDFKLGVDYPVIRSFEQIPEAYHHSMHCDHCNTNRERHTTYILKNTEGQYKAVGSTCLKDFFGVNPDALLVFFDQPFKDLEDDYGSGSALNPVEPILAVADLIISQNGFTSMSKSDVELGIFPTTAIVSQYLNDVGVRADFGEVMPKNGVNAKKVLHYFMTKEDNSNYVISLQSIFKAGHFTDKDLSLVVSAVGVYYREQARENAPSEYKQAFLGRIKEKVEGNAKVESIRPIETQYGVSYLIRFNLNGYCVYWFASKEQPMVEGQTYNIQGTVKKHEIYKDVHQTYLTRVKQVK